MTDLFLNHIFRTNYPLSLYRIYIGFQGNTVPCAHLLLKNRFALFENSISVPRAVISTTLSSHLHWPVALWQCFCILHLDFSQWTLSQKWEDQNKPINQSLNKYKNVSKSILNRIYYQMPKLKIIWLQWENEMRGEFWLAFSVIVYQKENNMEKIKVEAWLRWVVDLFAIQGAMYTNLPVPKG